MKYIKLILLVFSLLLLPWAGNEAWAKDAEITDLRWTARNDGDPPFVRIVTDLTKAVQAEAAIDKSGKNFEVILKNTQKSFSGSQYDMDPRAIEFATVSEKDGDTYIDVTLTKPQKIDDIHVFALTPVRDRCSVTAFTDDSRAYGLACWSSAVDPGRARQ